MEPDQSLFVGHGARTVTLSPNGREAFLAINASSEVVGVDLESFSVFSRISANSFPVGLDVSSSGKFVWSTSQGKAGRGGGNAVNIYQVQPRGNSELVLD